MPFYDYKCASCNEKFEILRGMNEKPFLFCPKCKSNKVAQVFYAPRIGKSEGFEDSVASGSSCNSCSSGTCGSCRGS